MNTPNMIWRERASASDLAASVWSCTAIKATTRMVIADPCSSISLITENGSTKVIVRGPETKPRREQLSAGYTCTTIRLYPGVLLKGFKVHKFVNRSLSIWSSDKAQFWFHETYWHFPGFDSAEVLVEQLHNAGYLQPSTLNNTDLQVIRVSSPRTYARLVRRVTGLTPYQLYQLNRTHQALRMLKHRKPATEVALGLDFVDQAHFTNSLRRFLGTTPKEALRLPQSP